ncbi:hypothetical protein TSUD_281520 [Trifolium subterraneum]|uniref:Replication protein A 70 kDa DNA-binding subunit B/D first OB fold domain-containing protein n=1 Tax=Trifolium subterraneum TaxID=3900 RepID=A0A2Z6MW67_TRISU|nr:hypothetical protein TSUD_281520 [Trifolium subterraneum]
MMALCDGVTAFNCLSSVKMDWCIRVRVVRMWNINSNLDPEKIKEIELILLDSGGKKIQANVPSHCVYRLSNVFFEDGVYVIAYFRVIDNISFCMNPFKLVLCAGTTVITSKNVGIPHYSLTLFDAQKISNYQDGLHYLIDVIGVVTDVQSNPDSDVGAVKITLADKSGICVCFLYGDYADQFKDTLYHRKYELPVLVLQFVNIKVAQGLLDVIFVESVEHVTRVLLNPSIPEVEQFKIEMGYASGSNNLTMKEYYSGSDSCRELEFNGLYPHKTIYEFVHALEDGLFVLCPKVSVIFKVDQWFYPVCDCGNFLEYGAGSYYCVWCHHTVFSTASKCKFQMIVHDDTSAAVLPICYNLLQEIDPINDNGSSFVLSDDGEQVMSDKTVLMIMKKVRRVNVLSDDDVEVVHMTDAIDLIKKFHDVGSNFTPIKSIFETASTSLPYDLNGPGFVSPLPVCVNAGKTTLAEYGVEGIVDDAAVEYRRRYKEFKVRSRNNTLMKFDIVGSSSSDSF